jgi:hypothetical protein
VVTKNFFGGGLTVGVKNAIKVNFQLRIFNWFLYAKDTPGGTIVYVTENAPSWDVVRELPLIEYCEVVGMYRLNS